MKETTSADSTRTFIPIMLLLKRVIPKEIPVPTQHANLVINKKKWEVSQTTERVSSEPGGKLHVTGTSKRITGNKDLILIILGQLFIKKKKKKGIPLTASFLSGLLSYLKLK